MRKKTTWIALVLALALFLGTLGMVFAGDFGVVAGQDLNQAGHPPMPDCRIEASSPLDDLLTNNATAYKFVSYTLWLLP